MEGTRKPPWSDLPPEILSMIGCRLHTRVDVLRFRSVCSSFRSSIPPLRHDAPQFPFRLPCPPGSALFLRESTVYALETPDGAASGRARWLLKLEESEIGDMRILSLFSRRRIADLPRKFPEVLDSLQFRIVEICREYALDYMGGTGGLVGAMRRLVVHPDCVWTDVDQCSVYFIDGEGRLGYWKPGDENWRHLGDPRGFGYDDIVVFEGKVCVVDRLGSVSQIDSSFKLRSFSPPIDGGGFQQPCLAVRLVVSSGDLYVVDRYIRHCRYECDPAYAKNMMTCDVRVYRLDQHCGRWEEVRSLGNSAFFLFNLCSFAISARELDGCEGDCIYYTEKGSTYFSREEVKVFSLADRSHKYPDLPGLLR